MPGKADVPDFLGQGRRRNGEHGALGMGQAVSADLAGDHPGQCATAASSHDQQVTGAGGDFQQDTASLAPPHEGLDRWVVWDDSPDRDESIPEALPGRFVPFAPQITGRLQAVRAVAARRHPRQNRYQSGAVDMGQVFRVAQRPEAARGAARADNHAAYAGHGSAPSIEQATLAVGRESLVSNGAGQIAARSTQGPARRDSPEIAFSALIARSRRDPAVNVADQASRHT